MMATSAPVQTLHELSVAEDRGFRGHQGLWEGFYCAKSTGVMQEDSWGLGARELA